LPVIATPTAFLRKQEVGGGNLSSVIPAEAGIYAAVVVPAEAGITRQCRVLIGLKYN